ncbi:MAG: adenosylmethionine--8-amino-7-oxononanoate transaminase [Gammaproteobacteria bacterium]|nr:adenosylmethionine--8-amino-7-oxononanoate transaminase [Gammaproteobacteria bacterium]MCW5583117.1 adenosylmethionine--8-amino-7-oxononanoate transaminase [Gammaproteobacteria bacterium]
MQPSSLIDRDLKHIWHPCSQMKDYEIFRPLEVIAAKGSYIELQHGKKIIDAISSWWCKSLGHNHPRLKHALVQQMEKFEHVILANTTNETIVRLSERLCRLTKSLNKVFYASEGSSAIEIAMKMSLHARYIQGDHKRNIFIALENGYHGETLGALSISDIGIYRSPYTATLLETYFISPIPYVHSMHDDLWRNCDAYWEKIEKKLDAYAQTTTAVIVEPIVQGAGGMKLYSQDFLKRLRVWADHHNVHLIADEIMTGIGRTGKMLACDHAGIEPDFLCLSKGLTSGWLPLSAVLTKQSLFDLFYDDYETGKSFLHSHTYSGNALAASIAVEVLNIVEEEHLCLRAEEIGLLMYEYLKEIARETNKLKNIRQMGAIVAAELVGNQPNRRLGYDVYRKAVELGALLRPLGNTIYWLPPLTIDLATLHELKSMTEVAIQSVF